MIFRILYMNCRSYVIDAVLYRFQYTLAVMNDCMTYTPEPPGRVIVHLCLSINFCTITYTPLPNKEG